MTLGEMEYAVKFPDFIEGLEDIGENERFPRAVDQAHEEWPFFKLHISDMPTNKMNVMEEHRTFSPPASNQGGGNEHTHPPISKIMFLQRAPNETKWEKHEKKGSHLHPHDPFGRFRRPPYRPGPNT